MIVFVPEDELISGRFTPAFERMRCPIWIGLILVCGLCPGSLSAASPQWAPVTAAELAEDKPQIEPEAAAEIITYRLEINDKQDNLRDVTHLIRYKIFDPSRAVDITRVARFWSGHANNLYQIMARLTLPDGTTRVFDKNDMRGRNVAEEGRANGILSILGNDKDRVIEEKFLAVTGVVKGAVLDVWEFEPNIEKADWMVNSIQRPDTPIRQFEYVSRYKPDIEIQHRHFVLNPCGGKLEHDDKAGILRFTAQNLPSIHEEPFSAPESYYSLTIIETYENLTRGLSPRSDHVRLPDSVPMSLGPWAFYSTAQDYQDADKGYADRRVKEKAEELVSGVEDPREKARRIYIYVRSLYQKFSNRADLENWYTRYVDSIDELIDLDKIDSTIIRDQDFRYLFVGLARSAGLECHSVYHPSRSLFPFSTDMVSESFLSNWTLAVKVGDGWVLCDPCSDVPLEFGLIPWDLEGQPALMALPRQQKFLNVPALGPEGSESEANVDVDLDGVGNLTGTCVCSFTGHAARTIRARLDGAPQEKWGAMAKSLLDLEYSSCEVKLKKVDGLDTPEDPLRIEAALRWPSYAAVLDDRMTFVLSVWTEGRPPLLNESKRTTPVFFDYARTEKETIRVHLPSGYALGTLPKPITGSGDLYSYSLTVTPDPSQGAFEVQRIVTNGATEIQLGDYPRSRDWFRRVSAADQIGVVLGRTPEPGKNM
jgi:hypothetical protein